MSLWLIASLAFASGYATAVLLPIRLAFEENETVKNLLPTRKNLAWWILFALAISITMTGSVAAYNRSGNALDTVAEAQKCQSEYNRADYLASKARTDALAAADEAREEYDVATQDFLVAAGRLIAPGQPTQEEIDHAREASASYDLASQRLRQTTLDLKRAREENPYPEYPTDYCDPTPELKE